MSDNKQNDSTSPSLAPSQALPRRQPRRRPKPNNGKNNGNGNGNGGTHSGKNGATNNNNNDIRTNAASTSTSTQHNGKTGATLETNKDAQPSSRNNNNSNNNKTGRSRRRRNNRRKNQSETPNEQEGREASVDEQQHGQDGIQAYGSEASKPQQQEQKQKKKQQKKKNGRTKKASKKKYPWRRFIKPGTVDPITLESLLSLEYPPFALMAEAPYDPVPVWPPLSENGNSDTTTQTTNKNSFTSTQNRKLTDAELEELNQKRLAEQWGGVWKTNNTKNDSSTIKESQERKEETAKDSSVERHYNLYDGRALAYYSVSQLQFIDPLNRRDLTRDELLNLDVYLRRHGFQDLNVTEAYDAKGITISTAGATAATAQGRTDILQQMASNLLNSLFGGQSVSDPSRRQQSYVQEQYEALQTREHLQQARTTQNRERQHQHQTLNPSASSYEFGVYASEDGGLMVIDDDENPGMRGGDYTAARGTFDGTNSTSNQFGNSPFYSAAHIAARHGNGAVTSSDASAFPALPTPASAGNSDSVNTRDQSTASEAKNEKSKKSETKELKHVGKSSKTLSRIAGAVKKTDPMEQYRQREAREAARKRAMAANLSFGVDASIIRTPLDENKAILGESIGAPSNASNEEQLEAKIERNRAFAEALGVKPATIRQTIVSGWARPTEGKNQPTNEFVNELGLITYPDALLAQARDRMHLLLKIERKWKMFLKDDKSPSLSLHPMDKPARIFVHHYSDFWNLKTESFDPEPHRYIHCVKMVDTFMPHPLLSDASRKWRGPSVPKSSVSLSTLPSGPSLEKNVSAEESGAPKLELAKRTIPLERPPFESPASLTAKADDEIQKLKVKREEQLRRQREAEDQKRKILEAAFASDEEEEDDDDGGIEEDWGGNASIGSEWSEAEAVLEFTDEEN